MKRNLTKKFTPEVYIGYYKTYSDSSSILGLPNLRKQPDDFCVDSHWNFIGWNYARGLCRQDDVLHFYVDDSQFSSLLTASKRESYLSVFRNFRAVCSPDFSVLPGMPAAVGIFQKYKALWFSCWLQEQKITVIPAVNWSEPDSFFYCFSGIPRNQVVSVQIPKFRFPEERRNFVTGWGEMLKRLLPRQIVTYGMLPDCVSAGDIPVVQFPRFKPFNLRN